MNPGQPDNAGVRPTNRQNDRLRSDLRQSRDRRLLPRADSERLPIDRSLLSASDLPLYLTHLAMPYRRIGAGISVLCAAGNDWTAERGAGMRRIAKGAPILETITCDRRDFETALRELFPAQLERSAVHGLMDRDPALSARMPAAGWMKILLALFLLSLVIAWTHGAEWGVILLLALFGPYYLASVALRTALIGKSLAPPQPAPPSPRVPVVTILVPLFRETRSLPILISALQAMTYPKHALDVKFLVEASDAETLSELRALGTPDFIETLIIPHSEPQTKPKAMNYALPFARGEILGIFDAEDIPAPDQIRRAVDTMDSAVPGTVCVQARLNHYNARENWLSRCASIEYALWFDLLLTGLSRLRMPVPLGGTSVYVKTAALREIGGWDPDNVTEDADLGVRLARRGWRTELFESTTEEEAPIKIGSWIRQRTRWIKGFILTWMVHMRRPRRLVRDLGWRGALVINVMLMDGFVAFLAQPLFLAALLAGAAGSAAPVVASLGTPVVTMAVTLFAAGQILLIAAAFVAARRRFGLAQALWTPTLWFYWMLGGIAAIRAVWQVLIDPHAWEKTDHGISHHALARREAALRMR